MKFWVFALLAALSVAAPDVKTHTDAAKGFLYANKLTEAIEEYEKAIKLEPTSYLSYFGRATVHLSAGQNIKAIDDLTAVLRLNSGFTKALEERAKITLQEGMLDMAIDDYTKYHALNPSPEIALKIDQAREALAAYNAAMVDNTPCERVIELLSIVVTACPHHVDARMKRADCYVQVGGTDGYEMAAGDYIRSAKLRPDNTIALLKVSQVRLTLGEVTESLVSLKECLRYDQDHKQCKALFRGVKKFDKEFVKLAGLLDSQSFPTVIKSCTNLLEQLDTLGIQGSVRVRLNEYLCRSHAALKDSANTKLHCDATLKLDENNLEALIALATSLVEKEEYEEAMRLYKRAHDNTQDRRAGDGYNRAQRLLKQASQKNYYKVLDVARDISKRDLRRAYRKMAQKWHPDKHTDKVSSTKRMNEINEAYEVLKDDELRTRFDNGDDPNSQEQHHRNPFSHQGGNPFSNFGGNAGGGFQFHFQ